MGSGKTSFSDALWCCANLYSDIKLRLSHKRLMIFTCRDEPHGGDSGKDRQARTKAGDLKETGVIIDLMHLLKPGGFDVAPFFRDIISPPEDESELGLQLEPCEKLEDLEKRVRAKKLEKRANARIHLCLGEGVNVAVGLYSTAKAARKPSPIKLYRETNEPVNSKTRTFHTETGSLLLPSDIKKSQVYGKKQIVMEKDEVDAIKKFEDPAMSLIGFKPMERLKRHHHIRPAEFLYPEEDEVKGTTVHLTRLRFNFKTSDVKTVWPCRVSSPSGSACLFSALLTKCHERNVFALCRCISRRNMPPRFVALVPQKEELDEGKVQISASGFHVIYLPYADDFRTLDPPQCPTASQSQVDKMKEIVSKLRFKYRCDAFENPALQQQYRNLEALALDMMAPEDTEDLIMPKVEQMNARLGPLVQEFKDLVYPADYNPEGKPAAKRKTADAGGGAEKKPKVEVPEDELRERAQNGTLGKLTVPVLKEACKKLGVHTSATKKQELIDALRSAQAKRHFQFSLWKGNKSVDCRGMECACETDNAGAALPALIRWPIRLFCSLTGLSALWSWVGRLVGTLRGIQSLCKWLSRIWGFVGTSSSKLKWLVAVITGSSGNAPLESESTDQPGLRLILLGPAGGGRTSLADTLLGNSEKTAPMGPLMQSTKRRAVMGGREVVVIDTPDLLGSSLGNDERAREALRSLQLAGPGPHAFLLVIAAGGSGTGVRQDTAAALRSTRELFGDGVATYVIPVLTHAARKHAVEHKDSEGPERTPSPCDQRSELVDNGPDCPPQAKSVLRRRLVGRVTEMSGGHFVHELQRREERVREELLADMGSALAGRLGHM
ncbi:X-ray repair cross-complementing protein 5 [Liparis tanakae]|uniref:X-ray repair cross-complementing protein 5 n=1 Tax=Liparis tanakae TaxID=230148 RepID=A0A4Z2FCY8_9TELE|nr:X-ray repair cross-complementing protein 5 [Liparis tanakae]